MTEFARGLEKPNDTEASLRRIDPQHRKQAALSASVTLEGLSRSQQRELEEKAEKYVQRMLDYAHDNLPQENHPDPSPNAPDRVWVEGACDNLWICLQVDLRGLNAERKGKALSAARTIERRFEENLKRGESGDVEADGGAIVVAGDEGEIIEDADDGRPEDCGCGEWNQGSGIPCFSCFLDGFDVPVSDDE